VTYTLTCQANLFIHCQPRQATLPCKRSPPKKHPQHILAWPAGYSCALAPLPQTVKCVSTSLPAVRHSLVTDSSSSALLRS
jgi:hypothetical protein